MTWPLYRSFFLWLSSSKEVHRLPSSLKMLWLVTSYVWWLGHCVEAPSSDSPPPKKSTTWPAPACPPECSWPQQLTATADTSGSRSIERFDHVLGRVWDWEWDKTLFVQMRIRNETRVIKCGIQMGIDLPQMGQIWDFLLSVHFGSSKLILKSPRFVLFD